MIAATAVRLSCVFVLLVAKLFSAPKITSMNPHHLLLSAATMLVCVAPCAAQEAATFFPVMAWDHVPNNAAVIKKIRECGFTIAGFAAPGTLDACHAEGLKAIVSDDRVSGYDWTAVDAAVARKRVTELIAEVRNHPAVFGYYLRDEPTASFFPGLATVSAVVKERHPGAWPYINLFPNYANAGQLGTATYDEYVETFIQACKPPILSYDHYTVLEGGGMGDNYYSNLESVRRASIKHDVPFWQIVLAVGCLGYREPTPTDFRFQAYTSLAYGARGLTYFKYFTPAVGNFRNGPIDQFGNETPTWPALRQVNLQIGKLGPTLLKLKSDRVYHFGDIPPGCTGQDDRSFVKAIGGPMLVGDFTHADGSRYVMVVNKSFTNSVVCGPQFREPVSALIMISAYSGRPTPYEGEQTWLAPGQGVLLQLKR
jgi:hypothetical protein